MNQFQLTYQPLQIENVLQWLQAEELGAHVIFTGTVRNSAKDKKVMALEFEAYEPMAISELNKIEEEIRQRWPIQKILLHHQLGRVEVGGIPVIAGIASVHRREAFEACAYLMNRLKETVPIWKKELFEDGSHWVSATP
jgi:molybdopterin synthase catalytic subunit